MCHRHLSCSPWKKPSQSARTMEWSGLQKLLLMFCWTNSNCRRMRALTFSLKNLKGMKVQICWKISTKLSFVSFHQNHKCINRYAYIWKKVIMHFMRTILAIKGFMCTSLRTKFLVATEVIDHFHHHPPKLSSYLDVLLICPVSSLFSMPFLRKS